MAYMQRPLGAGKPDDRFPFQTKVGMQSEDKVPRKSIDGRPIEWGNYGLMSEKEDILTEQIGRK